MRNGKRVGVVIPAGGSGTRIGGDVAKQFLEIGGTPVIVRTLRLFQQCAEVDEIAVAVSPGEQQRLEGLVRSGGLSKVTEIVPGGAERQESVWNALQAIERRGAGLVLIHDAVRPFVTPEVISAVLAAADRFGAAIPVIEMRDTVKSVDAEDFVTSTPDRRSLRQAQTPQGFEVGALVSAFRAALKTKEIYTDDAAIAERIGLKVKTVPGNHENIKITTISDLRLAESILGSGKGK